MRVDESSRNYRHGRKLAASASCMRGGDLGGARTSRLATLRLMHVAAETGARFVREGIDLDPLDWLLTGRELFDQRNAVEACGGSEGFRRAIVLHGLSLGLDTSPGHLARIPAREFLSDAAAIHLKSGRPSKDQDPDPWEAGPLALYTCSISADLHDGQIQVFGAMIARDPLEVRRRLKRRYGPLLEDQALVRLGFDWSEPLACAMVSGAMANVLGLAAESPRSALADGLDFYVEQRFAS